MVCDNLNSVDLEHSNGEGPNSNSKALVKIFPRRKKNVSLHHLKIGHNLVIRIHNGYGYPMLIRCV